jgi:tRNA(Ile)-lysidine synthase
MDVPELALAAIQRHEMLKQDEHALIALSGGPDSVCLASVLSALPEEHKVTLSAHYVDHGLRPDETPAEIEFCSNLCKKLGIGFSSSKVDASGHASSHGMNLQEAARELRYKALEDEAAACGCKHIAMGHNLDDQAETFFMRILRGSGPAGLSGIPPVRGKFVRPLIGVRRSDIEKYLSEKGLEYITDTSNLKDDYLRNRLRRTLVPILEEINPSIVETVGRTTDILAEEERYFFIEVTKALMRLISSKGDDHIELFLVPLESLDRVIARRVIRRAIEETRGLRRISHRHVEDILRLVNDGKPGDGIDLPDGVRAIKKYSTFLITCKPPVKLETRIMEGPGSIELTEAGLVLKAEILDEPPPKTQSKYVAAFDAEKVSFPLTVRARRDGDFIYPLGLGKKKKLQDLFVDEKVPRYERDAVPIVTSGEDILWAGGVRADDRFQVNDDTKRVLALILKVFN